MNVRQDRYGAIWSNLKWTVLGLSFSSEWVCPFGVNQKPLVFTKSIRAVPDRPIAKVTHPVTSSLSISVFSAALWFIYSKDIS